MHIKVIRVEVHRKVSLIFKNVTLSVMLPVTWNESVELEVYFLRFLLC